MRDAVTAFLPGSRHTIPGARTGPLAGCSFAVKDLIDLANIPTLGGTPDWSPTRATPTEHAVIVQRLLDAGASVIGKTVTDEVSLGILGENVHDGTPPNPAAPSRVPGGSSSGSASAVAAGECDFALGTDTGGSVRVPASFCGLYGIRPTHGRLPFTGITVQAPDSDTVGWFARDPALFARIGETLFAAACPTTLPNRLIVATDAFGLADPATAEALLPIVDRLATLLGRKTEDIMAPPGLSTWQNAQRILQSSQSWQTFAPWLDMANPRLAWSVARGLAWSAALTDADRSRARLMREEARARLRYLLAPGTLLCLPTTPFPAPLRGLAVATLDPLRDRISCLTSHGGLTGVPQVSIPGASVDGAPVGLSLIAARGADLSLLATARALAEC